MAKNSDKDTQFQLDVLNTTISNYNKLVKANEFLTNYCKDAPPDIFNTISGLLYQAITDTQKKIVSTAQVFIACVELDEDGISGEGQPCFHPE